MFRNIFKKGPTTKGDVIMAVAGALVAGWKAIDTIKDYRSDNEEENDQ